MILLPRSDLDGYRFPPSVLMAKHVNLVVGAFARRWIFHHPEDDPLADVELPPWSEEKLQVSQKPEDFLSWNESGAAGPDGDQAT